VDGRVAMGLECTCLGAQLGGGDLLLLGACALGLGRLGLLLLLRGEGTSEMDSARGWGVWERYHGPDLQHLELWVCRDGGCDMV
jgi:hypothetical protein